MTQNRSNTRMALVALVVVGLLLTPIAGITGSANAQAIASVYNGDVVVEDTNEPIGEEVTLRAFTDDGFNEYSEEDNVTVNADGTFSGLEIPEPEGQNDTIQFRIDVNGNPVTVDTATWEDGGDIEVTITASVNELDRDGSSFDVTIDEQASTRTVAAGEDLQIVADIENTGDVQDNQTIELTDNNGNVLATDTITLGIGETGQVSLNYTTAQDDTTIDTVAVSSNDDSATTNVDIQGPPLFDTTITDAPAAVTATQNVTVTAEIQNTGDSSATQDIVFTVNGTQEGIESGVTLGADETRTVTFNYTTEQADVDRSPLNVTVTSEDTSESRDVTVNTATGSVTLDDQATNSTQLDSSARTTSGVVVESPSANLDSVVVVTYDDGNGNTVIAGVEQFTAANLNGSDVTVPIEDAGGFPGSHTAHVIPLGGLSTDYTPGDTVSTESLDAVLDNETATVFQGSVALDNQSFVANTSNVTVATSDLAPQTEYVIVVHPRQDDGTIGAPIGSSGNLTGAATDTTVSLDSEINETGEFVVMLHPADGSASGYSGAIRNADADAGFVGGNIADAGTVTIQTPATGTLSTLAVNESGANGTIVAGENTTVRVDVENTGDVAGEFEVGLTIDTISETQNVSVASGATNTTTFTPTTDSLTPDNYTVTVSTADDTVTGTLEVLEPATPSLASLDIAGNGTSGDIVEDDAEDIAVNVTNTGEEVSSFNVTLDIEGQSNQSKTTATLAETETDPINFADVTSTLAPDTYNVTVTATAGDRTDTIDGTLTVRNAASTNLTDLAIAGSETDVEIVESDSEDVAVNVTNTGDLAGSTTLTLTIGDSVERTERVLDLAGGATETVTFTSVTDSLADGTYTVTIATSDDSIDGSLTVLEPATADFSTLDIANQGTDADVFTDENESISVDLANAGDVDESFDVAVTIDNSSGTTVLTETQTVTVNASEPTLTVETRNLTGDLTAGTYTVTVASTNTPGNSLSGDLRVRTPLEEGASTLESLDIAGQGDAAEVVEGNDTAVTVVVNNTGTTDGAVTVDLEVTGDETVTNSTIVEVDGGSTTTATFTSVTGDLVTGDYTVTASTPDDSVEGNLTILEPPRFELSDLDIDGQGSEATITAGSQANVTTTFNVTNAGEAPGNVTVDYEFSNETITSTANLSDRFTPGLTDSGEFTTGIDGLVPDEYNITVTTPDDSLEGALIVEAEPTGGGGGGDDDDSGGGGGGGGLPTTSGSASLDDSGSASIDLDGNIENIGVTVPNTTGQASVESLDELPEGISEPPQGQRIVTADISAPNPSDGEGPATVRIQMSNSIVSAYNADAEQLAIVHYVDGEWQEIDTTIVGRDPLVVEAPVDGFSASTFAVVETEPDTDTDTPEPEPDTDTPEPEPDTDTPEPEPDTDTPEPEPDTDTPTSTPTSTPGFGVVVALLGFTLAISYTMWRRRDGE